MDRTEHNQRPRPLFNWLAQSRTITRPPSDNLLTQRPSGRYEPDGAAADEEDEAPDKGLLDEEEEAPNKGLLEEEVVKDTPFDMVHPLWHP